MAVLYAAPDRSEESDAAPSIGAEADWVGQVADTDLSRLLADHDPKGRAGSVVETFADLGSGTRGPILLVGIGGGTPDDVRRAGAALARRVRGRETVAVVADHVPTGPETVTALAEGLVLGSFSFHLKTEPGLPAVRRVLLGGLSGPDAQAALDRGRTSGSAAWRARALALTPPNIKNPVWLAEQATTAAQEHGLDVRVWDEAALRAGGFGGILGVGQGSHNESRLVSLSYEPPRSGRARRRAPHIVLVGKGITFDSGGLSIKPSEAMSTMKRDMTGAGVVLAVMEALREVGCPVRVTGLMACAENAVGGSSMRPGDVLRHYGGRTSEVTNTDAEGRLVLADALAYAVDELSPTVLVDVATLTGAVKVALGQKLGGLFANDETLAATLLEAGQAAGEPVWRLPLAVDYADRLESGVADADNAGGGPGAITAALFLQHFVGDVPWAHLDIASVGDSPVDAHEWTSGATGFGARLLLSWLSRSEPLQGISGS